MKKECHVNDSFVCIRCRDRICSKVSILETILGSGDVRRISMLGDVLNAFNMRVMDLI